MSGCAYKSCTCCGESRPREAFPPNARCRDGLSSWCRACANAATRRWRAANPDAVEASNAARRRAPLPTRTCPECGEVFQPRRRDSTYCSAQCGRVATSPAAGSAESSYRAMIVRCTNRRHVAWSRYGGAGIVVAPEWLGEGGFERFLEHIGERPAGTTLDRIDPHGSYVPGNVRWATPAQQQANQRPRGSIA